MTTTERKTFMSYLSCSYNKMMKELRLNQLYNSDRFPQVSKELASAKNEFDLLSSLARALNIPNPYELKEWEIQTTEEE